MLGSVALVAVVLSLRSQYAIAGLVDTPDSSEFGEFDATLIRVERCPGNNYTYKMLNPVLKRKSPDTVCLWCELEITEEIPLDPTYTLEVLIEHSPSSNKNDLVPIATYAWPNICGELQNDASEAFKAFRDHADKDMKCPIHEGTVTVSNLEMNVDQIKPLMRNGRMILTVKHVMETKGCFGCSVIEFDVNIDVL